MNTSEMANSVNAFILVDSFFLFFFFFNGISTSAGYLMPKPFS